MRVRVVLLDEDLVPRLETYGGKWRLDIENRQRLLTRRDGARLGVPGMPVAAMVGAAVAGAAVGTVLAAGVEPERVAYPRARDRGARRAASSAAARPCPAGSRPRSRSGSCRRNNSTPHCRPGRDRDRTNDNGRVRAAISAHENRRRPRTRDDRTGAPAAPLPSRKRDQSVGAAWRSVWVAAPDLTRI